MMQGVTTKYPRFSDSEAVSATVPQFLLYGELPEKRTNWFVNIEHLADRCRNRGWRIEPHAHPNFGQLMFIRSGRGVMKLEDRSLSFESPYAMLIPPDCVHGFNHEVDSDGWVLTIEATYLGQVNGRLPEFSQLWASPRMIPLGRDSFEVAEFHATLKRLEREVESRAVGHIAAAEALLTSLFVMLVRCAQLDGQEKAMVTRNQASLVERFRQLIDRHYRHDWQIQEYASAMAVSMVQLRSACVTATGQTPIKMIHAHIITEAKRNLIFGDMSIVQIAYWLGFADPAYFIRFFKKEVGQSPGLFRMTARKLNQ